MSGKRNRLDLNRLEMASLQKYARKYRLPVTTNNRHELESQVAKHFNGQQFMLDEEEVLLNFIRALKANAGRPKVNPAAPQGYRPPQVHQQQMGGPPGRR